MDACRRCSRGPGLRESKRMNASQPEGVWEPDSAPVAVVMITLNEGHNMEAVLANLRGWAQEVFVVDSYSQNATVDIALRLTATT